MMRNFHLLPAHVVAVTIVSALVLAGTATGNPVLVVSGMAAAGVGLAGAALRNWLS